MVKIEVKESGSEAQTVCEVVVSEGTSQTTHRVTVPQELYERLTSGKITKADCVKTAFRFLLDRESKESILRTFDLPLISRYFPEFEKEFHNYLGNADK
ncbi:MAG: hypothetical protein IID32_08125 [Planctomycetes bacterium]|nr:hypothetical protein [Planctomycetota bacterium]